MSSNVYLFLKNLSEFEKVSLPKEVNHSSSGILASRIKNLECNDQGF